MSDLPLKMKVHMAAEIIFGSLGSEQQDKKEFISLYLYLLRLYEEKERDELELSCEEDRIAGFMRYLESKEERKLARIRYLVSVLKIKQRLLRELRNEKLLLELLELKKLFDLVLKPKL